MPAPKKNKNARKGDSNLKRFTVRLEPAKVAELKKRAEGIRGGYNALLQQIIDEYLERTRQT
jgi:hypothetical protein